MGRQPASDQGACALWRLEATAASAGYDVDRQVRVFPVRELAHRHSHPDGRRACADDDLAEQDVGVARDEPAVRDTDRCGTVAAAGLMEHQRAA